MRMNRIPLSGFSLIEILITLAILGILAAFAIPQYNERIRMAKRADGQQMLTEVMQSQERYFTRELSYTSDLRNLGYVGTADVSSSQGHYQVSAKPCPGYAISQCVRLLALPANKHSGEDQLTLNSLGERSGPWE